MTAQAQQQGKLSKTLRYIKRHRNMYILMIPGLIFFAVFRYLPLLGNIMAFQDFKFNLGIWGSPFVGFANFRYLFTTDNFLDALRNSIWISLLKLAWGFPAPILLALIINEVRWLGYKRFVQTSVYLPHFISWPIIGGLVIAFLSPTNGIINHILKSVTGQSIFFLAEPRYFRSILVITDIWRDAGWGTVVYMATLAGINPELYEAATVDGAGRFARLRYITLPHLRSTIVVLLILRTGNILENGFDQIFMLYNSNIRQVGDVLETFIYRMGLVNGKYALSTAAGMFQSVVGFILISITNRLAKLMGEQTIY